MVDDPNRKSVRQFTCREHLWDSFEQLGSELECSVDYLINEAMRQYLRAHGRTGSARSSAPSPEPPPRPQPTIPPLAQPPVGRPQPMPSIPQLPPQRPPAGVPTARPAPTGTLPPLPGGGVARPSATLPPLPSRSAPSVPARPAPPPTPPPPAARSSPPVTAAAPVLYVRCEGEDLPVAKEEFWIGRGTRLCDLVIKDTNISRQHARVVFYNGHHWLVDNESTNGIEFHGAKVQQKRVEDGDVFVICGHELHFYFR